MRLPLEIWPRGTGQFCLYSRGAAGLHPALRNEGSKAGMRLFATWILAGIGAGLVSGALFGWLYAAAGAGIGAAAGVGIAVALMPRAGL